MLNRQIEFTLDHNHQTFQKLSNSHSHDSLEIMLCLSDGGTFCVENYLFPLYRGTLVLIQGGVNHHCIVDVSSFERYSLRIPYHTLDVVSSLQTDFKAVFDNSALSINLTEEQVCTLHDLMDKCLSCGINFGEDFKRVIFFFQILLFVGQMMRSTHQSGEPSMSRDYKKILPAMQYIHDHYDEDINVEQLSRICYLSRYYLSHLFHEVTGFSVKTYIVNYRIRRSCELLNNGCSVQDAGISVGFSNSAYFIQTFKRIVGITPGKYAQEYYH